MNQLKNVDTISEILQSMKKGNPEFILCVMSKEHRGYNHLKLISETEVSVITQCCLSTNKINDQYLALLALNINAKLGGTTWNYYHHFQSSLCFTFAQCTKPASLVPLVFYADQAAYRGRLYQEAIVDRHFQSSSSAQSVKAAFDKSLYKLCPNLENSMFFICFCWTTFFFVFVVAGVVSLKCHFVGIM